jgi:hypothetical protein
MADQVLLVYQGPAEQSNAAGGASPAFVALVLWANVLRCVIFNF